ncbi:MAG: glycerol-3-phosphate 1-O-acyltransferase PlsY [Planctomycetota bacterium]
MLQRPGKMWNAITVGLRPPDSGCVLPPWPGGLSHAGDPREGGKYSMVGPGELAVDLLVPGGVPPVFFFSAVSVSLPSSLDLFTATANWMLIAAFLSGSIPFTWCIARTRGIDLLTVGSGNPGATNLSRVVGKGYGALGLVLDVIKGALPVLVAQQLGLNDIQSLLVGAMAVLGHCFSPFLLGRGGKGVATTGGALLALEPLIALSMLATWLFVRFIIGSVGMASVGAAVMGVLISASLLFGVEVFHRFLRTATGDEASDRVLGGILLALSCLVIVRHRSNIVEYRQGCREESPR